MRPKKNSDELAAMIMQEVRKRAECSNVLGVVIVPNAAGEPDHPNWKAGFTADGPNIAPEEAYLVARKLSAQFDWDEQP